MEIPVVVHIPHASSIIPSDLRQSLLLDDNQLRDELLKITDWFTECLFSFPPGLVASVEYPVSRLVCDPERFENDIDEPMSGIGMGVLYTITHSLDVLRNKLSSTEQENILDRFYRPHHKNLESAVSFALDCFNWCLIVDCHSFPSTPLPYERNSVRPDICIGTDSFHTPRDFHEHVVNLFSRDGWSVLVDEPYAGTMVPSSRFHHDSRVVSIMIEVNRGLYMDEDRCEPLPSFQGISQIIHEAILNMVQYLLIRRSNYARF